MKIKVSEITHILNNDEKVKGCEVEYTLGEDCFSVKKYSFKTDKYQGLSILKDKIEEWEMQLFISNNYNHITLLDNYNHITLLDKYNHYLEMIEEDEIKK